MADPGFDTVLLIHGLWMTSLCWEHWTERFRGRGINVIAPGWPGTEVPIEDLRKDASALAPLGVREIVDHYDKIIRALDRPPVLMGHSFGGLFVQMLLDRGLGAAGISIDGAPAKGIKLLPASALVVAGYALKNPANRHRTVALNGKQFHYAFGNSLTREQSDAVHARYAIPGPGRPLFQAAFANVTRDAATTVNFANSKRAPLLLVGGGKDHVVPASVTKTTKKKYKQSTAVTDLTIYPDRTHYTLGQQGWEKVADDSLAWARARTA